MQVRISHIIPRSHVDGPGERTVVFFQGCNLACPGCQNQALWSREGGNVFDTDDLATTVALLAGRHGNVTITGGEPFQQVQGLAYLVKGLRAHDVKNILVYSGYTWEQIMSGVNGFFPWCMEVITRIDGLVDGPFIQARDHDLINWRGSDNQRPLDVQASLDSWIHYGKLVLMDWEGSPVITLTTGGEALIPIGLGAAFSGLGKAEKTRICGQIK